MHQLTTDLYAAIFSQVFHTIMCKEHIIYLLDKV